MSLPVFHLQNRNNWSTVQLHGNIMKVNTIKVPNYKFYIVKENRRGCLELKFCQLPLPTKLSNGMTAHDKKRDLAGDMLFPKGKLYNTRTLQQHICVSAVQVKLVLQRLFFKKQKNYAGKTSADQLSVFQVDSVGPVLLVSKSHQSHDHALCRYSYLPQAKQTKGVKIHFCQGKFRDSSANMIVLMARRSSSVPD